MTMESSPQESSGGGIGAALGKKLGPLPAWGWAVAIAGSVILYRIVRGKGAFPKSSGSSVPVGNVAQPVVPGSASSLLGQLSASDLAALRAALAPPSTSGGSPLSRLLHISGVNTLYQFAPGTTKIVGTRQLDFTTESTAPVVEGVPGYYMITEGPNAGWYAVKGKTDNFFVM